MSWHSEHMSVAVGLGAGELVVIFLHKVSGIEGKIILKEGRRHERPTFELREL